MQPPVVEGAARLASTKSSRIRQMSEFALFRVYLHVFAALYVLGKPIQKLFNMKLI